MDLKFKCLNCGKKVECDAWYAKEIEDGNQEQLCGDCKNEILGGH